MKKVICIVALVLQITYLLPSLQEAAMATIIEYQLNRSLLPKLINKQITNFEASLSSVHEPLTQKPESFPRVISTPLAARSKHDGTVQLCSQTNSGGRLSTFLKNKTKHQSVPQSFICQAALSEHYVATTNQSNMLAIQNLKNSERSFCIEDLPPSIKALTLHPTKPILALAHHNCITFLHFENPNNISQQRVPIFDKNKNIKTSSFAYSPCGTYMVIGSYEIINEKATSAISTFDIESNTITQTTELSDHEQIQCITFFKNNPKKVILGCGSSTGIRPSIQAWDITNNSIAYIKKIANGRYPKALCMPDERTIIYFDHRGLKHTIYEYIVLSLICTPKFGQLIHNAIESWKEKKAYQIKNALEQELYEQLPPELQREELFVTFSEKRKKTCTETKNKRQRTH